MSMSASTSSWLRHPCAEHARIQPCRPTVQALRLPHTRRTLTTARFRLGNLRFDGTSSSGASRQRNNRRESTQPRQWTEGAEGQDNPGISTANNNSSDLPTSIDDEEDENFSQFLSFLLLGMWGLVLLTSVNAVVGYISHQAFPATDMGLVVARQQAQRQAVYSSLGAGVRGASSRAAVAASPGAVTPFTLMLRALAAMCGVFITVMVQATVATQVAFSRVWYALIIALVGSVMHFF